MEKLLRKWPVAPRVEDRIVEPGAGDGNGMETCGECRLMRAGVDPEREAAHDRDGVAREAGDQFLARFLTVARHRAAAHDREQLRPFCWQCSPYPQPLRRLGYLEELFRPFTPLQFSYLHRCSISRVRTKLHYQQLNA